MLRVINCINSITTLRYRLEQSVVDIHLVAVMKNRFEFLLSLGDLKTLQSWQGKRVWVAVSGIVARHEKNGMGIMFDEEYQISSLAPNKAEPIDSSV